MIELNDDEQKVVCMILKNTQWGSGEGKSHMIADDLMSRIIEEQKAKIKKGIIDKIDAEQKTEKGTE